MLHFHCTLSHQALPLGGHEDRPKADFLDLHLALTLEGRRQTTLSFQSQAEELEKEEEEEEVPL